MNAQDRIHNLISKRRAETARLAGSNEMRHREQQKKQSSLWTPMAALGAGLGSLIMPGAGTAIGAALGAGGGIIKSAMEGGDPFNPEYLFSGESLMSLLPMVQSMASAGLFQQAAGGDYQGITSADQLTGADWASYGNLGREGAALGGTGGHSFSLPEPPPPPPSPYQDVMNLSQYGRYG
jgi:hypothetical protein